ncbi:TetR/AcrR family transcriptional regulator [Nonomuraea turkmeniaca]|uniref:TetR/AcrR family transcriptional regulator n=1 Tax=Nonomuraea turkmeniaca TaxID=103838 RepID=A0A5S4FPA5_9ACTN|nr:TetR/AcrR family transcriptional regulator [Nonomuraea turkmeniaca]
MPRPWKETIEAHRRDVRDAILECTSALVAEHGLRSVTMSQIAEQAGIGRATLYKYFPDIETILLAWHERQVATHLDHLAHVRDQAGEAGARLQHVLVAYAFISRQSRGHGDSAVRAFLHRDEQVAQAHRRLHDMIGDLLAEGARSGAFRDDVPADELATYCLHAVSGAGELPSEDAVHRLVTVIMTGLRRVSGPP